MYRVGAYFRPRSCGEELDEAHWDQARAIATRIWTAALLASIGMAGLWLMF
jgi:hypothetical protein